MNSFRILSSLLLVLTLGACSNSGDDGEPRGQCKAARCLPTGDPKTDLDQPNPFFEQNAEYSAQFIQNALDEKRDIRLQQIYQSEKVAADRDKKTAQRRVNDQKLKVRRLENELAELKAKNGDKAQALNDLKSEKRKNQRKIDRLNVQISNLTSTINDAESEKSLKESQKLQVETRLRRKRRARDRKQDEIENIRTTNENLRNQNKQAQRRITRLDNQISKLEGDLSAASTKEEKQDIRQKIKDRRQRKRRLNRQIADNQQTIQNNRQKLPGLRAELRNLQRDVDRLVTEVSQYKSQIGQINSEIRSLERDRDLRRGERRSLVAANNQIDNEIAGLGDLPLEISQKESELAFAQDELAVNIDQLTEAIRVYKVKSKNFADHTASVKIKTDTLKRLERLNDEALAELYLDL